MGHCERNTGGIRMGIMPSGASVSVKICNTKGIADAASLFHEDVVAAKTNFKYLNFPPVSNGSPYDGAIWN